MSDRLREGLVLLLPALLVGLSFALWCWWPLAAQHRDLREELAQLVVQRPPPGALEREAATLVELRRQVAALDVQRDADADDDTRIVAEAERAAWHQGLSETLARHGLAVLEVVRADADVPTAVAVARRLTRGNANRARVPAWEIRLRGRYQDVVAALSALPDLPLPVHVLRVALAPDGTADRTWTLTVC